MPLKKAPPKPNLFKTWRKLRTKDDPVFANALRELASAMGMEYSHSRYKSWEEGERLPQTKVFNYILIDTLNLYLDDINVEKTLKSKIIKYCTLNNK